MKKKLFTSFASLKSEPDHVLVYSTDPLPKKDDKPVEEEKITKINPTVRLEKKGRGGKSVTVLARLPKQDKFLKELCKYLKNSLGTGGTYYIAEDSGVVEVQGDYGYQVVELAKKFVEQR